MRATPGRCIIGAVAFGRDGSVHTCGGVTAGMDRWPRISWRTGTTPAMLVERPRVEAARVDLEQTSLGLEAVARACGFGRPETARRAFRRLPVGPESCRRRFAKREKQERIWKSRAYGRPWES